MEPRNGGHVADSRSPVVQPCARCGARWAVQGKPLHWCPRCHGVLLSPAPVDAPPARRNYRWVARPPGRRGHPAPAARRRQPTETPRYLRIPRWGLQDRPPQRTIAPPTRFQRLVERIPELLMTTAGLFVLAALAEFGRYGVLLRNRTRLIPPWLLYLSDGAVYVFGITALLFALVTAVAMVGWLARTRRAAFAAAQREDPRSLRALILGCVVPGVNLVWPGVFLTDAVRARAAGTMLPGGDPRLLRTVRIWWAAWVLNGILVVVAQLYRFADTLQAQADGVLVAAWTDLAAAAVAVLTLWMVRTFDGRDLRGREVGRTRWLVATAPAEPVIEPVHPGAESARARAESEPDESAARESGSAGRAPADAVGNDEAVASNPEEVLAK
ncbi:DUF4328 domain-containing protein [Nocardia huaxiensis]|uniref:DUF4328 domain-containing protein n=1 Tax=Nocardia huaxiensis TaxID=2755382 RepID=A0A7D6V9P6_9NOCA|nr:DUF4328 domain-containing protein [Nocardia huaxiensis]